MWITSNKDGTSQAFMYKKSIFKEVTQFSMNGLKIFRGYFQALALHATPSLPSSSQGVRAWGPLCTAALALGLTQYKCRLVGLLTSGENGLIGGIFSILS